MRTGEISGAPATDKPRAAAFRIGLQVLLGLITYLPWSGTAYASPGNPQKDLETLRLRLEARDARIRNIWLAYEATKDSSDGRKKELEEFGWWYWQADLQAAAAVRITGDNSSICEHVVWDGSKARRRWGLGNWSEREKILSGDFPAFPNAEIKQSSAAGPLGSGCSPGQMGLFTLNRLWSSYLGTFSQLHVAETVVVDGQELIVLVGDMDGRKEDEEYTFPWRITFDSQKLLATRIEMFTASSDSGDPDATLVLIGTTWYRSFCRSVDEFVELASGIWIGTHGFFEHAFDRGLSTEVRVLPEHSFINGNPPERCLVATIEDGVRVDDVTTGQHYCEGHRNEPDYELNEILYQQLRAVDPELGREWRKFSGMAEPLTRTNFAGATLYAFVWLNDRTTNLQWLLEQPGFQALSRGDASKFERIKSRDGRMPILQTRTTEIPPGAWQLGFDDNHMVLFQFRQDETVRFKPLSGIDYLGTEPLKATLYVLAEPSNTFASQNLGVILTGVILLSGGLWVRGRLRLRRSRVPSTT